MPAPANTSVNLPAGAAQTGAAAGASGRTAIPPRPPPITPLTRALDRLDAKDDKRFRNRRTGDRLRFRQIDIPARISHPGGSHTLATVASRNLSASGIGLIVNNFLHTGTRVELVLKRLIDQTPDRVMGTVVFCTHVSGTMHQVGVRFDAKLFPTLYAELPAVS